MTEKQVDYCNLTSADLTPGTEISGFNTADQVALYNSAASCFDALIKARYQQAERVIFVPPLNAPYLKKLRPVDVPARLLSPSRRQDLRAELEDLSLVVLEPDLSICNIATQNPQEVTSINLQGRLRWKYKGRELSGKHLSSRIFTFFLDGDSAEVLKIATSKRTMAFFETISEEEMEAVERVLDARLAVHEAEILVSSFRRMELDRRALVNPFRSFGAGRSRGWRRRN